MGYSVTNSDRLAMIEILNVAWNVNFQAATERGDSTHTRWSVQAPNPHQGLYYRTYYTTDGSSITEAINNWFSKMELVNGVPVEREVWTSLWDSKMDLVKDDILGFKEED